MTEDEKYRAEAFRVLDELEEDVTAYLMSRLEELCAAENMPKHIAINFICSATLKVMGDILDESDKQGGHFKLAAAATRLNMTAIRGLLKEDKNGTK